MASVSVKGCVIEYLFLRFSKISEGTAFGSQTPLIYQVQAKRQASTDQGWENVHLVNVAGEQA
jgi:hypothetical protein